MPACTLRFAFVAPDSHSMRHRALLVTGTTSLLVGFSLSTTLGCECCLNHVEIYLTAAILGEHPATLSLLVGGGICLILACVQECHTSKTRFIPAGVFAKNGASEWIHGPLPLSTHSSRC